MSLLLARLARTLTHHWKRSLGAAVLVYTGLALSLRRLAAWRNRRNRFGPTDGRVEDVARRRKGRKSSVAAR